MINRNRLTEKIRKKEQEIQELEAQIREARAYIQALQETMKLLPRGENVTREVLRTGSMVAEARRAIREKGAPMHVNELLQELGRVVNKKNRASLSGSLAAYVRRKEIFTRPAPNTFGLIEMQRPTGAKSEENADKPPPDFGMDDEENSELDDEIIF